MCIYIHTHKKRGNNIIYELLLEVIIHHHVIFYYLLYFMLWIRDMDTIYLFLYLLFILGETIMTNFGSKIFHVKHFQNWWLYRWWHQTAYTDCQTSNPATKCGPGESHNVFFAEYFTKLLNVKCFTIFLARI